MPLLFFSLLPAQVGQLHDILSCLVKFDEDIFLEASSSCLRISSLNSSKSAHACFTLKAPSFFVKYKFQADQAFSVSAADSKWGCKLQNRALLSILKKRGNETKEKETALELCEFELQARTDEAKCRLMVRMSCRHGVVKTYRLTYEALDVLAANFDRPSSPNCWTTSARTLRDMVEFFGAKTDQLDWAFEKGRVTFTSYTEKVANGRDIFKQPMHTSVAMERKDFTEFNVQEGLHIGIVVRDFRAIVSHADGLGASMTASYSRGNRPMQISYDNSAIFCEFTLMTRGQPAGTSTNTGIRTSTPARDLPVKSARKPQPPLSVSDAVDQDPTPMPPPAASVSLRDAMSHRQHGQSLTTDKRPEAASRDGSPPAPSASLDQNSLFFPAGEDEHFWDEHDDNTVQRDDFVTWDASGRGSTHSEAGRRIRDSEPGHLPQGQLELKKDLPIVRGIAPTQRLSQLKGLFD